ncbi:Ctr copper transporter [Neofusicoccum parvum]|uniref:Copper transport protein n=1 Tax=Botryosphaeria parva (strain UCR-NP2) TaxID=1287680 RepID=R1GRK4_BOTPV|nr:putative copper transporter protein [Neofusicoccum parvum UCRNP2]GME49950.1 Ctr copper transporter [Neofusicoccum parvum]
MERRHSDDTSMSMDMGSDSSSMTMNMAFTNAATTPLYTASFSPSTVGQYAGICIFLIILATVFRGLFAAKAFLEDRWLAQALQRRYIVVADKTPAAERIERDDSSRSAVLTANGVEERVTIGHRQTGGAQPWRFGVDLPRAAMVTVIAGVGYLLMLAVMTMNVGYLLSVLGGTFLGEVAFGRYSRSADGH